MNRPMNFFTALMLSAGICGSTVAALNAQEPNPTAQPAPAQEEIKKQDNGIYLYRVKVVQRDLDAVNYLHRSASTNIAFKGTTLLPLAKGSARVVSERGGIHISARFQGLTPANGFGPEYLTYVLWAITPDGRPNNLGEVLPSNDKNNIDVTTALQSFGMIVTAEPYYAVTQPSDVVVMENIARPDTRGVIEAINARYELLPRGMYTSQGRASGFVPIRPGKKDPFELYEAQNAVQLARVAGADKYASDSYTKAAAALDQSLRYQVQKPGQKPVITMAREACVRAEDARVIAIRAERQEAADNERNATLARESAAQAKAQQESEQRALAEADRAAAERAKGEAIAASQLAERDRLAAVQAKREAEQAKGEADQARQAAIQEQQRLAAETGRAQRAAADADALRMKAEQDQARLRAHDADVQSWQRLRSLARYRSRSAHSRVSTLRR